jgi:hypothetical protein
VCVYAGHIHKVQTTLFKEVQNNFPDDLEEVKGKKRCNATFRLGGRACCRGSPRFLEGVQSNFAVWCTFPQPLCDLTTVMVLH